MASFRQRWRLMTAILQIAALVVLALPAQAAGHRHAAIHHHAVAETQAEAAAATSAYAALPDRGDLHTGCWLGCCACHAVLDTVSVAPVRAGWIAGPRLSPAADSARPGAWPETLPEPPRTDA